MRASIPAILLLTACLPEMPPWPSDTGAGSDTDSTPTDDTGEDPDNDLDGDGYTVGDGDCDDTNDAVHPTADERCNGVDDDCDGTADEGDAIDAETFYVDDDGDGHGVSLATIKACTQPQGYAGDDDDCDDAEPLAWTDAEEICNDDVDNDCDPTTDCSFALTNSMADATTRILGESGEDNLGYIIERAGDTDDDGNLEFFVAVHGYDTSIVNPGAVLLFEAPLPEGDIRGDAATTAFVGFEAELQISSSVNNLGDINLDGHDDIAIGAARDTTNGVRSGAVVVLNGPFETGEIDISQGTIFRRDNAQQAVGWSLVGPGDITSDGIADLIVGGPEQGIALTGPGQVYVVAGPAASANDLENAHAVLSGRDTGGQFGKTLESFDANGDTMPDLLSAAPLEGTFRGNPTAGAVYLFHGPLSGEISASNADSAIIGSREHMAFGAAMSAPGDLNGDGYEDIVISSTVDETYADEAGTVRVFHGPFADEISSDAAVATYLSLNEYAYLGEGVDTVGDYDGDGNIDLLLGTWNDRAYLVMGPHEGAVNVNGGETITFLAEDVEEDAGLTLSGLDDFTGDGRPDFAIGALTATVDAADQGAVYFFAGQGI